MPLLCALFLSAPAAAPSPEQVLAKVQQLLAEDKASEAVAEAEQALERFGAIDADAVWELRVLHGRALITANRAQKARDVLAGIELPPRLARSKTAVQRLIMLATAYYRANQRPEGLRTVDAAERLAQKYVPQDLAQAMTTHATIEGGEAGEEIAHKALDRAIKTRDAAVQYSASGTLALLLAQQEQFEAALEIWKPMLEKAPPKKRERLEGNLGWAYASLGDRETAEQYFKKAAVSANRDGSTFEFTWVTQLGTMRRWQNDGPAASRYYRRAISIGRQQKDKDQHKDLPLAFTNYAILLLQHQCYDYARRYVAEGRRAIKGIADSDHAIPLDVVEGRIDTATNSLGDAERLLRAAVRRATKDSERWNAQFYLAELYAKRRDMRRALVEYDAAIAHAARARAEIKEAEQRLAFNNNVDELYDSYVEFLVSAGRDEAALQVTEHARAATLKDARGPAATAAPRTIARRRGAVLLCYWLGATRSHLWIVTPGAIERKDLPPEAKIANLADEYQKELLGRHARVDSDRGKRLYTMLVAPAAHVLKPESRVIVVPDGSLHAMNFEALVVPSPKPHYWIEDAIVSNASSLQLLSGEAARTSRPKKLLLIGNPPEVTPEFPQLRLANEEIEDVARHFANATVIREKAAVPEAYGKASPAAYDVIHFATHAVATRSIPLDSAIILGRGQRDFKLYARDIQKRKLRAQLVTISSCQGVGQRQYAGEGLVGLSWAFLNAGAQQVIAALWAVDDEATPQLMDKLYEGIAAGQEPAAALRQAKLAFVRSDQGYWKPKFWAPFVLYSGS
ncbi:MAG TPA: CHAT domain-containing protein [Thermoanaerobaculia bacterium]